MTARSFPDETEPFAPTDAAPLTALPPVAAPAERGSGQLATFLYARFHNFTSACQGLSGAELTSFVNEVRRLLSSSVAQLGGQIAQRRPDSVLCVFAHRPEDRIPNHAKRAVHAAILTAHEAVQLAHKLAARHPELPTLSLSAGVHLGPGEVTPRPAAPGMVHAAGEAVEIARLLQVTAADLQWGVAASMPTRLAAGTRMQAGRAASMALPDDSFLELVEVEGLVPREGSTTPPSHYEALRESLRNNQQLARSARAAAMAGSTSSFTFGGHVVVEGYRLLRKIGEGGIATIYLAQPASGGAAQVLKVLRMDGGDAVMGLQRFMQEFALLAQIDHPNVARIHKQDFCAGNAYIAMEYFPLGDLRARMRRPLDPGIALYYLKQIAAGLDAVHQVGIVHRDLKPDNVMVRQDGTVAIADFGIAKQVAMRITDTGAGDIVGTPYYLSPEQAQGRRVDARCDLYSLGVLAFELLAGRKPYHAANTAELLQMHVSAPVPQLPSSVAHLQPVLEQLMAKNPADRFHSAAQLLDALEGVPA
jgi:class 3 adenylate cyclase